MKYSHEHASSAEILRLTLKKMLSQPAAFTPLTYAVWYNYIARINPPLNEAMSKLLVNDIKLDDEAIEQLYGQFIAEHNSDVSQELNDKIEQMLGKLAGSTEETHKEAVNFGKSLQSYGDTLKDDLDSEELMSLIDGMANDTSKMSGAMQQLQSQLEASKQEVAMLNKQLESARGEALTDPLTGVLNRRGFESVFDEHVTHEDEFSVLMIDIDFFKKINDTYGHAFGDKVLRAIASTLKSQIKGQDSVARLGGEEFAVLLPETDPADAFILAEHIRQTIEQGKIRRMDTNDQIGGTTISIGISTYHKGIGMTDLLDQADKALYASKKGGRNRTTIFGKK